MSFEREEAEPEPICDCYEPDIPYGTWGYEPFVSCEKKKVEVIVLFNPRKTKCTLFEEDDCPFIREYKKSFFDMVEQERKEFAELTRSTENRLCYCLHDIDCESRDGMSYDFTQERDCGCTYVKGEVHWHDICRKVLSLKVGSEMIDLDTIVDDIEDL